MERPNAWKSYDEQALQALENISLGYRRFLDNGKTERECVTQAVEMAQKHGYVDLSDAIREGKTLKAGDKVYVNQMGKAIMLFHLGEKLFADGINIVGAHIDSPRIDLKQNPFYEDTDLAYADTHYYGGIKKYQWVARALALHGVAVRKDGTKVNIVIGEDENDPVVGVSDPSGRRADGQERQTGRHRRKPRPDRLRPSAGGRGEGADQGHAAQAAEREVRP